jgi:hypothetical protein
VNEREKYMIDICENCYEEANIVAQNMCASCVKDEMGAPEVEMLDNIEDMVGVMSDDDVVDMFRDEYLGY